MPYELRGPGIRIRVGDAVEIKEMGLKMEVLEFRPKSRTMVTEVTSAKAGSAFAVGSRLDFPIDLFGDQIDIVEVFEDANNPNAAFLRKLSCY